MSKRDLYISKEPLITNIANNGNNKIEVFGVPFDATSKVLAVIEPPAIAPPDIVAPLILVPLIVPPLIVCPVILPLVI